MPRLTSQMPGRTECLGATLMRGGLSFHCRFVGLPLQVPLADGQDTWLGLVDPAFATTQAARAQCAEVLRSRHLQ